VQIADCAEKAPAQNAPQRLPAPVGRRRPGLVEIALSNGRVVKVEESIDPVMLSRIVSALDGST
jgi:hypothetical protein